MILAVLMKGMRTMIPFSKPTCVGSEIQYIQDAIHSNHICGDGKYTKKCSSWLQDKTGYGKVLYTTSCTHALEMAALLIDINPGDEVIMPSYTFASTADAFVLRGAKVVFCDIRPDTMNIDEKKIEEAITGKTKAIVVVHYAGVSCEMDEILKIAKKHKLYVIEDAAQGFLASYKGMFLGGIGDFGCYSFHETKNISMGEGGAILLKNDKLIEKAEIIREKGTNRSQFWRGEVDKYTWVDVGSSYLPSEINMAYLWAQLEHADEIMVQRKTMWMLYKTALEDLEQRGFIELAHVPKECQHNAHMFYIKVRDLGVRSKLIEYLKRYDIQATFHYIPLHTVAAGKKFGTFNGDDIFTTIESERLLRLPLFHGIKESEVLYVSECIHKFYEN